MKKVGYVFALAFVCTISYLAILNAQIRSGDGQNGARGFDHFNFDGKERCQLCHIPQNNQESAIRIEAPLWKYKLSSALGTIGAVAPGGISKVCLSCHDGSIAIGVFSGQTGGAKNAVYEHGLNNSCSSGLCEEHPVSIDYAAARAAGRSELRNETTYVYAISYDDHNNSYVPGTTKTTSVLLDNGKVECTSCHLVHSSEVYNLRMPNRGSLICLACHII